MAKTVKKMSRAAAKTLDLKHFGGEPVLKKGDQFELLTAYNWFNYICDSDQAKQFVVEYLAAENYSKEYVTKVKQVDAFELRTIGWTLRLAMNGSKLEDDVVLKVLEKLDAMVAKATPATVPSVVRRVSNTMGAEVENAIMTIDQDFDQFVDTGESKFNVTAFLDGMNLGSSGLKQVKAHYLPLANELHTALNGQDADIKEVYAPFRKPQLRKMLDYVSGIVGAFGDKITEREDAKTKTRKPRRKKIKTPEQLATKVQYLPKYESLGLTSVEPAKIIGAEQVWLFNTKDRKLSVINSASVTGLSIKGTSIINMDETTSKLKRVRKPEPVLKNLLTGGKVTVRKLMEGINSVEYTATGRMNRDTVIVKVVK